MSGTSLCILFSVVQCFILVEKWYHAYTGHRGISTDQPKPTGQRDGAVTDVDGYENVPLQDSPAT